MPTVDNFQHLGHFPFCPERIDVDDFHDWVTLGGYAKAGADAGAEPSTQQLDDSLENAKKLIWDLYGFDSELSASVELHVYADESTESASAERNDGLNFDNHSTPPDNVPPEEPEARVCLTGPVEGESEPYIQNGDTDDDEEHAKASVGNRLQVFDRLRRMYFGGEFIGYGLTEWSLYGSSAVYMEDTGNEIYVILSSWLEDEPHSAGGSHGSSDMYAITTISGIPVIGLGVVDDAIGADSLTPDLSELSLKASWEAQGLSAMDVLDAAASVKITGLKFYEYS